MESHTTDRDGMGQEKLRKLEKIVISLVNVDLMTTVFHYLFIIHFIIYFTIYSSLAQTATSVNRCSGRSTNS